MNKVPSYSKLFKFNSFFYNNVLDTFYYHQHLTDVETGIHTGSTACSKITQLVKWWSYSSLICVYWTMKVMIKKKKLVLVTDSFSQSWVEFINSVPNTGCKATKSRPRSLWDLLFPRGKRKTATHFFSGNLQKWVSW